MDTSHEWWEDFFRGPWGDLQARGFPHEKTAAEVDFLITALELEAGQRVLDLACGTGRHSIELVRRGIDVTGVDFNDSALEVAESTARSENLRPQFVQRDMRELEWKEEFDAAFCFWTSFGYFEDEADNLAVARRVATALQPGGRFLIDTQVTETMFPVFTERRWSWLGEEHEGRLLEEVHWNLERGRADAEWTFIENGRIETSSSSVRTYSYRELCSLLRDAGFAQLEGLETLTGDPFALGSRRLSLIARLP